jgi:hypothetical protein
LIGSSHQKKKEEIKVLDKPKNRYAFGLLITRVEPRAKDMGYSEELLGTCWRTDWELGELIENPLAT